MPDEPSPHVSEADAFTLQLERDPALRATIVGVGLLDSSPDWSRLVERVDRASRQVPTLRERLVPSPLRMATPRWVPDRDFDLSWHMRRVRLPEGGDLPELLDLARTAAMDAFDHDRPLWELVLVEGMAGGRAALVLKLHHALTDGIGGVQVAAHVVDLDRDGAELGPMPAAPTSGRGMPFGDLFESLGHDLRQATDLGRGAVRAAPGATLDALRDPVGTVAGVGADLRSVWRMVRPITSTRSPVMRDRRLERHFEVVDVPTADLHDAGAAVGGTLNDAFVAGIAGGMRLYHQRHCANVSELRVTMPISTRTDEDAVAGNRVTLARFDLPVGVTDPRVRIERVHEICRRERHEPAIAHSELIAAVLNLLPVDVTAGMLHHVDLLASNVPGFDVPVYVAGAELEAFYPFGATLGSAANITLLSYDGTCNIGVNTDVGAVPDPDVFAQSLRDGFAEVVAVKP